MYTTEGLLGQYISAVSPQGLKENSGLFESQPVLTDTVTPAESDDVVENTTNTTDQLIETVDSGDIEVEGEGGPVDNLLSTTTDLVTDVGKYHVVRNKAVKPVIEFGLKKTGTNLGSYFVPYAGQALLAGDILDFLLPEGYSPYEGFGIAPDNPLANTLSWGNVRTTPAEVAETVIDLIGE